MKNDRKKQTITIVALVVAVLSISIGFAAFSNTLTIASSATVNPDSGSFKVVFSNINNGIDENPVVGTKTPNTITATNGTIDNSTNPTLSNLSATFTEPGQKVEYDLYVYNAGAYVANLNSVTFRGNKSCTPGNGADATLVSNACSSITMTVKIGNDTYTSTTQNITGKSLAVGASQPVKVTIEYASNGDRADGPFSVTFNDVSLYYNTTTGVNEEIPTPRPDIIYSISNETLAIGDTVLNINDYASDTSTLPNAYLKHEVLNNTVIASYACIKYEYPSGTMNETCVRGGIDENNAYYDYNVGEISDAQDFFESLSQDACYFDEYMAGCDDWNSYEIDADSEGYAYAESDIDSIRCDIRGGISSCRSY